MKTKLALTTALISCVSLYGCGKKKKKDEAPRPPVTSPVPAPTAAPGFDSGAFDPHFAAISEFTKGSTFEDLENGKTNVNVTDFELNQFTSKLTAHVKTLATIISSSESSIKNLAKNYGTYPADHFEESVDNANQTKLRQSVSAFVKGQALLMRCDRVLNTLEDGYKSRVDVKEVRTASSAGLSTTFAKIVENASKEVRTEITDGHYHKTHKVEAWFIQLLKAFK